MAHVSVLARRVAPTLCGLPQAVVVVVAPRRPLSSSSLAGNPADSKGSPSAFPWRETPHSGITGVLNWLKHEFVILRTHRRLPYLRDPSFLPGAEMAFVQVAAGAFQMRASQLRAPLTAGELGLRAGEDEGISPSGPVICEPPAAPLTQSTSEEDEIVDPKDVMDKELADFYINACAATNIASCTAVYRLHEVMASKVSNVRHNIWQTGTEESDKPESGEVRTWEQYAKDVGNMAKWQLSRKNDGLETSSKSTVQVDVDILCRETFFVMDDMTQQVVQGSKAIDVRVHRLRLEASPSRWLKDDFRWTAIDLDHWVKGNSFW